MPNEIQILAHIRRSGRMAARSIRPCVRALALLVALGAGGWPAFAHAQAGVEAAMQAAQAAKAAKQLKDAGEATSETIARPTGALASPRPGQAQSVAQSGTVRRPRTATGAPGRVRGSVADEVAGAPLPNFPVRLITTEPDLEILTHEARSDSAGRYTFERVETGAWRLEVPPDKVPNLYGAPRAGIPFTIAKRDTLTLPPLRVPRAACVVGHAEWSDGVPLSDGTIYVTPADTGRFTARGTANPVGDFELCAAPSGPVIVWLELLDGRRIGERAELAWGRLTRVDFRPRPLDLMDGATVQMNVNTEAGRPVPFAQVVLVGRHAQSAGTPEEIFLREVATDRTGAVDIRLPAGYYELLVFNPREGEWARREQYLVPATVRGPVPMAVVLRDSSSAAEREAWRAELVNRADQLMRVWQP
jgi:hypothetical protein